MAVAENCSEAIGLAQPCKTIHSPCGDFEAILVLRDKILFGDGDDSADKNFFRFAASGIPAEQECSSLLWQVGQNESANALEVSFRNFEPVPSHARSVAPDDG